MVVGVEPESMSRNRPCLARRWPTMSGMGEPQHLTIDQLRQRQGPLVDVRSPSEFEKGHWPGAINIPLFSDDERAEVGTSYKQQGRLPAIHLGLPLCGSRWSWGNFLCLIPLREVDRHDWKPPKNHEIR